MTDETDNTKQPITRRRVMQAVAAGAAAASHLGVVSANDDAADALFEDPTVSDRVRTGPQFVLGLLQGMGSRLPAIREEETEPIDTHVDAAVAEFEDHREEWLTYVNTRGLAREDHQSLELSWRYEGERRLRYVVAEYDEETEEYTDVFVTDDYDSGDVTATLRADAVENAAEELEVLHERFIVPDEDLTRSHISGLAGQYYFGSDHVTSSLLGGG